MRINWKQKDKEGHVWRATVSLQHDALTATVKAHTIHVEKKIVTSWEITVFSNELGENITGI